MAARTPLVPCNRDPSIRLKLETLQPVTSFKIRGVYHAVASFSDEQRARGVSTVSAGNTAQALAWSARRFGVPARSLMPDSAPAAKVDAVRRYGGEPQLVPVPELFRYLEQHGWEQEPYAFVHPWTERNLQVGHGTLGLELIEDDGALDSVFVPVGGGGLLGGVGSAIEALNPDVRIVAVEPEGCPALHESLRQSRPARVECRTICDGVAVPFITDALFPLLSELVDEVVLVSEQAVRDTIRLLALEQKVIAEPSGALAVAAALAVPESRRGRAACIVTGGSIGTELLMEILR